MTSNTSSRRAAGEALARQAPDAKRRRSAAQPDRRDRLPQGLAQRLQGARAGFSDVLTSWYRAGHRDLPWRRRRDAYAVWVSETMLQQTQVATVIPYFERWMERFPSLTALAEASEDEVLASWQGLGYYRRARNLLLGARDVARHHAGELPRDLTSLRRIPGVGPYTAGAIASIAFNQPAAIVDGNVLRVLCRYFGLAGDPTRAPLKSQLWALAAALIPDGAAREFNQALMELGATVCTPRRPLCATCPVQASCQARRTNQVHLLPALPARRASVAVTMAAAVVIEGDGCWLVKLPEDAPRWAGMWQFPTLEAPPAAGPAPAPRQRVAVDLPALARDAARRQLGLETEPHGTLLTVKHAVTHHRIQLHALVCRRVGPRPASGGSRVRLVQDDDLERLAMPAAQRKVARQLLRWRAEQPA